MGSGFSKTVAGYSDVESLKGELARGLGNRKSLTRLPLDTLAEFYVHEAPRQSLLELLWDLFKYKQAAPDMHLGFRLITDFRWRAIYTTNYDPVIETTLRRRGIPTRVVTQNQDLQRLESFETPVFKLHGCINELAIDDMVPLVVTESDYFDSRHRQNRELLYSRLGADLSSHTFVFVGYGMRDESFRRLWASVFFSMTEARSRSQIYNLPTNRKHFAITLNVTPFEAKFWDSYGIHVLNEDLEQFVQKLLDFKEKAFATLEGEYFPGWEYLFLTSGGTSAEQPTGVWHPPLSRLEYDKALWELTQHAFRGDTPRLQAELTRRIRQDLYLSALLVAEAKLKPEQKRDLAGVVAVNFLQSDVPGESQELEVSCLPWIWPLLNDTARSLCIERLFTVLQSQDILTIYKVTQVALEINSRILAQNALSFFLNHADDGPGDLCSSECTNPVTRFIRQLGYMLLSPDEVSREGIDRSLLSALNRAANPLLIWELGAIIGARCQWNQDLRRLLLDKIARSAKSDDGAHFLRYAHILKRRPDLIHEVAPETLTFHEECLSKLLRGDMGVDSPFNERLRLSIESARARTRNDLLIIWQPLLGSIRSGASRSIGLAFPATVRMLPLGERISTCIDSLRELTDFPFLAQPLLHILFDAIFRLDAYAQTQKDLAGILDILWDSEEFRVDDWARLIYVAELSLYLRKSKLKLRDPLLCLIMDRLEEVSAMPRERLTIRGIARQGLIPTSKSSMSSMVPNS